MYNRGATLLELLITIMIMSVLLTVAVPGLQYLVTNAASTSALNGLSSIAQAARVSAIEKQLPVTLCATSNYESCVTDWLNPKMVFIDANSNGQRDSDESILYTDDAISPSLLITTTSSQLIFNAAGTISATTTIKLCSRSDSTLPPVGLLLLSFGKIAVAKDTNDDGYPESATGTKLTCD